jgi:26S proteasome regulatory subunit N5
VIYYIVLAPRNTSIPTEAALLKLFTIPELMRWPIVAEKYGPHLCTTDVFSSTPSPKDPKAHQRYLDLRKRVIEHNVRVIAKYYTRISIGRLCQLLDLDEDETEKYISELVTQKTVYARIDRLARVVNFAKARGPDEVLNEWSSSMRGLLGLLERIDHLITKEEMMARIQTQPREGRVRG